MENSKALVGRLTFIGALVLFCAIRPSFTLDVSNFGSTNGLETKEPPLPENQGLDVSHYQGQIDWSALAAEPYRYVLIKATQGASYVDPRLAENARGAGQHKLLHGFYHFYDPETDAAQQANHFIATVQSFNAPLRPVLDVEITQNQDASTIRQGVLTWLKKVEEAFGCKPVLYTYGPFWDAHFADGFDSYGFWLADYASTPAPPKSRSQWLLWQYSQKGRVAGIPSIVDLDQVNPGKTLRDLNCHG